MLFYLIVLWKKKSWATLWQTLHRMRQPFWTPRICTQFGAAAKHTCSSEAGTPQLRVHALPCLPWMIPHSFAKSLPWHAAT